MLFRAPLLTAIAALLLIGCFADTTDPTATPTATATVSTEVAGAEEDASARIALLTGRTDEILGLRGEPNLEVLWLDDDGLAEIVTELLADPPTTETLRRDEAFYTLFGLIPAGTDLAAASEESLNAAALGLYHPESENLYVRGTGQLSLLSEAILSHEYTHHLQDVHFDLELLFEGVHGDRDAELALRALIEGDATYAQQRYVTEHFDASELNTLAAKQSVAARELAPVADVLTHTTTFVYLNGMIWIDNLLRNDRERSEIYADPPRTTREVLDPISYATGTRFGPLKIALEPTAIPSDWVAGPRETIGQLLLTIWLAELGASLPVADSAATGWAGDALHVFHQEGQPTAFVAKVAWERSATATEFVEVASDALDAHSDYQREFCPVCETQIWHGPAGTLAVHPYNAVSTLLAVAPSVAEV